MAELNQAVWQGIYKDALAETDEGKRVTKICAAESILSLRLQQMHHERADRDEALAIYDAIHSLRLLRCGLYAQQKREEVARMWKRTA